MENKTDKPYSLHDAFTEVSKKYGHVVSSAHLKISKLLKNPTLKAAYQLIYDCDNEAAELYKSKATEELRKENEELQTQISLFHTDREERKQLVRELRKEIERTVEYNNKLFTEIERLKESNKVKDEEINGLRGFNNTQDERWREYTKKLEESNKELVEALKAMVKRNSQLYSMVEYPREDMSGETSLINAKALILKSEGDVNKKI